MDSEDDPMLIILPQSRNLQKVERKKLRNKEHPKIKVSIMKFLDELAQEN
jgi:hypothetical protein